MTLPEELAEEAMEGLRAICKKWNLPEPYITKTVLKASDEFPSYEIKTEYLQ